MNINCSPSWDNCYPQTPLSYLDTFFEEVKSKPFHGHRAWIRVYQNFQDTSVSDELCTLSLWCYLASFGMMRGSSKLSKFDASRLFSIVKILRENREFFVNEIHENYSEKIIINTTKLVGLIQSDFNRGDEDNDISPTDTLVSKIVLASIGCIPALDRNVVKNAKEQNMFVTSLTNRGVADIYRFMQKWHQELSFYAAKYNIPPARALDIALCRDLRR